MKKKNMGKALKFKEKLKSQQTNRFRYPENPEEVGND